MKDEDILKIARDVWLAILLQKFSATGESFYPAPHNEQAIIDFARRILAAAIPEGMVLVGWLDGRSRFFYANDPMYKNNHEGMREVFAAATDGK